MASLSFSNITESSFCACVTDLDTSYERDDRTIEWYINEVYWNSSSLGAYVDTSDEMLFDRLNGSTRYNIKAIIYYTDEEAVLSKTISDTCITNTPAPVRPEYFYWSTSKTSGGPFNLTASEWNRLTDNINEVRAYRGYPQYSFTAAYSGDVFTAEMYNQAVNAVKGVSGYGAYLSLVCKGDIIYASQMNILKDELNAIP